MANVLRPVGLRPSRYLNGSPFNGQSQLYFFAAANATSAFKGDIVQFDSTNRSNGITDPYSPGVPAVKAVAASITAITAANVPRGVIAGFLPQPEFNMSVTATLGLQYRVASTLRYAWVIDDPMMIYQSQEITANSYTSTTANGINKTCDISWVSGNTTTGISKSGVTGHQTSIALPLRAIRMSAVVDNWNFTSSDGTPGTWWDVMFNGTDLQPCIPAATVAPNFGA
jgi:hypothetical protein